MRNWKEICAKCADGEIEPECEYYGEPNGCNSPTYQEHPHPGNMAAMREALKDMCNILEKLQLYTPHINDISLMREFSGMVCRAKRIVDAAISAHVRNCDLPNPEERYLEFCSRYMSCSYCPHNGHAELRCDGKWLLANAEKGGEA